jgi:hypothetical protein
VRPLAQVCKKYSLLKIPWAIFSLTGVFSFPAFGGLYGVQGVGGIKVGTKEGNAYFIVGVAGTGLWSFKTKFPMASHTPSTPFPSIAMILTRTTHLAPNSNVYTAPAFDFGKHVVREGVNLLRALRMSFAKASLSAGQSEVSTGFWLGCLLTNAGSKNWARQREEARL